jgi:hypothetical protein
VFARLSFPVFALTSELDHRGKLGEAFHITKLMIFLCSLKAAFSEDLFQSNTKNPKDVFGLNI